MHTDHVNENEETTVERSDQPSRQPDREDEARLPDTGLGHLPVEERLVTVFFKKEQFRIPADCYTTEQLIAKFPIEPGYLLNLKVDGELVTLKPGQEVCVKNGMHFYSQVPGGGSS